VCLPFLPADTISLGINVFEDDLPKDYLSTPFFTILLQYIRDTWVDESGATSITIHDHPGRSNLLVNQFHSQLKEAFSQAGTTVWHLISMDLIHLNFAVIFNLKIFRLSSKTGDAELQVLQSGDQ